MRLTPFIEPAASSVQKTKNLEEQIQEFILMIKQFESIYKVQAQMDADPTVLSQISN